MKKLVIRTTITDDDDRILFGVRVITRVSSSKITTSVYETDGEGVALRGYPIAESEAPIRRGNVGKQTLHEHVNCVKAVLNSQEEKILLWSTSSVS